MNGYNELLHNLSLSLWDLSIRRLTEEWKTKGTEPSYLDG